MTQLLLMLQSLLIGAAGATIAHWVGIRLVARHYRRHHPDALVTVRGMRLTIVTR